MDANFVFTAVSINAIQFFTAIGGKKMKYFAFIFWASIGFIVTMGIFLWGVQPGKVAGSHLEFEMSSGSRIFTQGAGTAHFTGCSFFELRDGNDTPIYGVNQSEETGCAGTSITSASVSLDSEDSVLMVSGRNVRVVMEASDDFVLVVYHHDTLYVILVTLVSCLIGAVCFIFGMGLFASRV